MLTNSYHFDIISSKERFPERQTVESIGRTSTAPAAVSIDHVKEMSKMKKRTITILAASAVFAAGIAAGVSASGLIEKIEAEIRPDFTIMVDGQEQTFRNVNGEIVYPVLYEGTTYLPVRAIGELMGKTVYWYENDKRIDLKTETSTVTDADVIIQGNSGGGGGTSVRPELTPAPDEITLDRAKEIALERAGLSASEVTFTKEGLETDDGVREYDIEFVKDQVEYSADVRASDGTITSWDVDRFDDDYLTSPAAAPSGDEITLDRAKEIALEKAGLSAADVNFTEAHLERDDGVRKYEIEFRQGYVEYSAEILASDGTIVSWDVDYDD